MTLVRPVPLVVLNARSLAHVRMDQQRFAIQRVEGWVALTEVVGSAGPDLVVIADPYADDETAPARELFELLETFPSIAVVPAFRLTAERAGDIRQMLQAGISGVVNLCHDTTECVVARHLREAVGRPFKRQVEALIPSHLSIDAHHVLRGTCDVALAGGGVDALADLFGVNAKTLSLWCHKLRLGPTRSLLVWIRLLLAALMLEDHGRTVESAARTAGYSSDRGLRRAFEQALGTAPSSVRRGGALAHVGKGFQEWLAAVAAGNT